MHTGQPGSPSQANPNLVQETNGYQKSVDQAPSLSIFQAGYIWLSGIPVHPSVPEESWEFSESKGIDRLTGLSTVQCRAVIFNFVLMPGWQSNKQCSPSGIYAITHKDSPLRLRGHPSWPNPKGRMKNGRAGQEQHKKSTSQGEVVSLLANTHPTYQFPSKLFPCFQIKQVKKMKST